MKRDDSKRENKQQDLITAINQEMERVQKNNPQDLQTSENRRKFVMLNILKGETYLANSAGFFYAHPEYIQRFCTPVANCNGMPALEVLSNGKRQNRLFFLPRQTSFLKCLTQKNKVCPGSIVPYSLRQPRERGYLSTNLFPKKTQRTAPIPSSCPGDCSTISVDTAILPKDWTTTSFA